MDARSQFTRDLLPGESILWVGQPDPRRIFSPADAYLVPFSVLWAGFAFVFLISDLGVERRNTGKRPSVISVLWEIPFLVVGLYITVGRFFYKRWLKRETYYAVTNQRVLVVRAGTGGWVQAAFIRDIPVINQSIRQDGSGTIRFGTSNYLASKYANTGLDFFDRQAGSDVPCFYDIREARHVHDLVDRVRAGNV